MSKQKNKNLNEHITREYLNRLNTFLLGYSVGKKALELKAEEIREELNDLIIRLENELDLSCDTDYSISNSAISKLKNTVIKLIPTTSESEENCFISSCHRSYMLLVEEELERLETLVSCLREELRDMEREES